MDDDTETFSVRKFLAFLGPGFLMCIGYVDPGNFESDLQAGVQYGFSLLWVLLWATIAGLFVQAMCVRLALATGWHLARVMRDEYPPRVRNALWVATELAGETVTDVSILGEDAPANWSMQPDGLHVHPPSRLGGDLAWAIKVTMG